MLAQGVAPDVGDQMRFALAIILAAVATAPSPVPKALQASFASLHPAVTLQLGKAADWVEPTDDAIWVGSREPFAVHRIDPATNTITATVTLPGTPCAGLAQASGVYGCRYAQSRMR